MFGKGKNYIGKSVREFRENQKLSQKDLCAQLQERYQLRIDHTAISKIESGSRIVYDYEVYALAKVLRVPTDRLFDHCTQ